MDWNQCKVKVAVQMKSDPQRATLASRAIRQVEEGLTQLRSSGFDFAVVQAGMQGVRAQVQGAAPPRSHTIEDATAAILGQAPGSEIFPEVSHAE